ncbi:MAG: hypothetical protein E6I55_02345 [Chloroflexi bacterium]|nr:MAG: hypothetical protein E6I55_02345 [Chloroflexota bacterium]
MMYNPDTMYKMARLEHEARIAFARQAVEAREARRESGRSWFASVTGFLRPARSSDAAAVLDISERLGGVEVTGRAQHADEVAAA